VRSLVEMHGGSVTAASAGVGEGSEFVVRLPLDSLEPPGETEDTAHPDPSPESVEARPRRVLVVEDNIDGARLMTRLLESRGHQTRVAHDGPSALEAAREQCPEVVLLDIGLPGMDGYQVAERLRGMEGMERALLVALTGYGQDGDRRRSHEAGIDLHKIKPVDPEALLKLVASDCPLVAQGSHTDQSY
jgi:two-component system CheB/CheR fusion protein